MKCVWEGFVDQHGFRNRFGDYLDLEIVYVHSRILSAYYAFWTCQWDLVNLHASSQFLLGVNFTELDLII